MILASFLVKQVLNELEKEFLNHAPNVQAMIMAEIQKLIDMLMHWLVGKQDALKAH